VSQETEVEGRFRCPKITRHKNQNDIIILAHIQSQSHQLEGPRLMRWCRNFFVRHDFFSDDDVMNRIIIVIFVRRRFIHGRDIMYVK
jgi:hypothetical protein